MAGVTPAPFSILLVGKDNLIGLVTCVSYKRLIVLHWWASRVLLPATLHLDYQNYGWSLYGLVHMEWSTDSCHQQASPRMLVCSGSTSAL